MRRRPLLPGACDFHAARASRIACDAFVQRFGDLLAVAVAAQLLLVGGTADERNFGENSRHSGLGKNHVGGFFHAAVAESGILRRQSSVKRALHAGRETARLLYFVVQLRG